MISSVDDRGPPGGGGAAPLRYTYAVGDVHGRLDLLLSAVEAIARHARKDSFRIVFLGDYIDRGPDSRGVIEMMMALQRIWPVVCLKGNHEDLMLKALVDGVDGAMAHWLANGGDATLRSYGADPYDDPAARIPPEHFRWLTRLPLTTGDPHRIFVHAGLMPRVPAHRQKEQTCLWIRERFLEAAANGFEAHVVHGHTPQWKGKPELAEPELLAHRTNLDTGAYTTGVLSVGVFDALTPGGPTEVLRIAGAPILDIAVSEPDGPPVNEAKERAFLWRLAKFLRRDGV